LFFAQVAYFFAQSAVYVFSLVSLAAKLQYKIMRAVIQRVSSCSVTINGALAASIGKGLMILLGIGGDDGEEDMDWLCNKMTGLRIFNDNDGVMNLSVKEIDGEILLVSQFTLMASTKKGNRPSYIQAARPEVAIPVYETMISKLEKELGKKISTGTFGADMKIALVNDGPVTIVIDTRNKQ
jgi:D-tyrosyl-tRNA(Tyr) deacylase